MDNATPTPPPAENSTSDVPASWERETLERILLDGLKEQRAARRWKIFFRLVMLFYVVIFTLFLSGGFGSSDTASGPHTALIDVNGMIADNKPASADNIIASLQDAFKDENTKGVILRINSPGGSPVQVAYISDEVKRLRQLHPKIKLYSVCTDMCASGGYWIAASGDQIYANPASLIGSIGVVMEGFGFDIIMRKIGIERRLITAGAHKGLLDPYSPLKPDEAAFAKQLLSEVHQHFIRYIMGQRGKRLHIDKDLFSGLAWSGEDALKYGLIDGFASESDVAREIIHEENIVDYTVSPNYLERLANQFGTTLGQSVFEKLNSTVLR
jgi:protease-4